MRILRTALLVALIAISGWYVAGLLLDTLRLEIGLARTALHGALLGAWLGSFLALLEYALLDWELLLQPVHWWERALQGMLLGAIFGAGSMVLAELFLQFSGNAPWARPLSWTLFGAALGGIEGIKWLSFRRGRAAALGAATGGLIGGAVIELAPALLLRPQDVFVAVIAAVVAMAVFGGLLGLGLAVSQALSRRASLTVLDAPMPKQRGQSFPVGSISEAETLGRLKATWTLTGDSDIQPSHAMLVRQGPVYAIHPLEGARVEVSATPFAPDQLSRAKEASFTVLTDPRQTLELRDGDVIRLGGGTYLYFEYKELLTARASQLAASGAAAACLLLSMLLGAPAAWAAPVSVQIQAIRGLEPPRVRADVLILRGDDPLEGLTPKSFKVEVPDYKGVSTVQEVTRAADSSDPNYIVLVIDKSGSMAFKAPGSDRNKLEVAKEAAISFVNQISPEDQVAIVSFDGEVSSGDFTSSKEGLVSQIQQIEMAPGYAGLTNIFDGIGTALELLGKVRASQPEGIRCAVVAMTDGAQTITSDKRRFEPNQLRELANDHRASIYTIGFGDRTKPKGDNGYVDEPFMRGLAQDARGTYNYALSAQDLTRAYDRILKAIQGQYRIIFALPRSQADPWTHEVRLRITSPEGEAVGARGYFSFGGVIPKAPGSLGLRTAVTFTFVLGLGLLAWLLPPLARRLEAAMQPTQEPQGLIAEATGLWTEERRRGAPPARQDDFLPAVPLSNAVPAVNETSFTQTASPFADTPQTAVNPEPAADVAPVEAPDMAPPDDAAGPPEKERRRSSIRSIRRLQ